MEDKTVEIKYNNTRDIQAEMDTKQNEFVNREFLKYYTIKQHITSTDYLPTNPKNFYDQIQFFDDGVDKKLYLYINNSWVSIILT